MGTYAVDRTWSDRYLTAIKRIIGPHLLEESSFEVDTKQAADLVLIQAKDLKIACRVRRSTYKDRYPYDITIRSKRDNGLETELEKIMKGYGDWLFYGHADSNEKDAAISRWFLVDLDAFRHHINTGAVQVKHIANKDYNTGLPDGTHFAAFDLRTFPATPKILIASSH